jgi:hypothetical protein
MPACGKQGEDEGNPVAGGNAEDGRFSATCYSIP